MPSHNILVTSVGRRTSLLQYLKQEFTDGRVIAVDHSNLAPALYVADKHHLVPRIDDPNYFDTLLSICQQEEVSAILSLIDPELSLLAKHSSRFLEVGVTPIVSPYESCETWLDKYASYEFCKHNGFKMARTYCNFDLFREAIDRGDIAFPVFIKPRKGSASLNISQARSMEEARVIFASSDNMIVQQFLRGQELGLDVYVDMITGRVVSIFAKQKISMRAGETDKAKSIKPQGLLKLIERLVTAAGLIGPVDIDVFEVDGEYYISEINPRFGGGYPLAYACGVNFPRLILTNLGGISNVPDIGNYDTEVYMMKQDSLTVMRF